MTAFMCALFAVLQLGAADIILIGDSTMCNYPPKMAPQTGWGMCLQEKCVPDVKVINRAVSGASIKSYSLKYWQKTMKKVKAGDFVVIGMAINDQGKPGSAKFSTIDEFKSGLEKWIAELKAKEALPMLTTSTVQWKIKGLKGNNGRLREYNEAILAVAKETDIPVVDLNDAMFKKFKSMPLDEVNKLFMGPIEHPKRGKVNDYTHFRKDGAELAVSLFIELCKKGKLPIAAQFK